MKYVLYAFLLISQYAITQHSHFKNPNGSRFSLGAQEQRTASVAYGDIDQDGDIDIVVANGRHWPDQNEVFLNNGSGYFSTSFPLGVYRSTSYAAEIADLDGDGDLDIVVGNDKAPNRLFFNDGKGHFKEQGGFGNENSNTRNVTLNDIDNDGDMDILVTNRRYTNEICLNNGNGVFDEIIHFGNDEDSTIDVEVEDMDGDGDKDLILANRDGQQNYIYLNDEMSFKERVPFGTGTDETRSIAVADFNQDGTNDLVLGNINEVNSIYYGEISHKKKLSFSKGIKINESADRTYSLDVGDIDMDGDIDILIGNSGQQNVYYLNINKGSSFEKHILGNKSFDTYDIKFTDINNDGKLDVIEANSQALNLYHINISKH